MPLEDLLAQGPQTRPTLLDTYMQQAADYRQEQMKQQELGMRQQDLASTLKYRDAQIQGMEAEQTAAQQKTDQDKQFNDLWSKWQAEGETITDPEQKKEYYRKGIQMAAQFDPQKAYALTGVLNSMLKEEDAGGGGGINFSNLPQAEKYRQLALQFPEGSKEYNKYMKLFENAGESTASSRNYSSADAKIGEAIIGEALKADPKLQGASGEDLTSLSADILSRAGEIYSTNPNVSKRQAEEQAYQEIVQSRVQSSTTPPSTIGGIDIPFTGGSPTVVPRTMGAQTKVINGITYVKVPGGWRKQ